MSSDKTDPTDAANPFAPPLQSTSARNLLTVALRILGFWLVCRSLIALPQIATFAWFTFQSPNNVGNEPALVLLMTVLQLGAPLVVGIALILLAPRISRRFHEPGDRTADPIAFGRVGAGDLYHLASFMMGVYALIQAAAPALRFVGKTMTGAPLAWEPWAQGGVQDMISAAIYSVGGLLLIFGGRGIAQAMAAISRDSENVPVPQFSIRMLLILAVALAVVLGVLKTVLVGVR